MYTPAEFRLQDPAGLRAFAQAHSFALLCTCDAAGRPTATHLPVLLDPAAGEQGVFHGHIARANPQWTDSRPGAEALLVFSGPHAYISPTWYQAPHTVPTWNYSAVHVTGRLTWFDDSARLQGLLDQLAAVYESGRHPQWRPDWNSPALQKMLKAIVGFDFAVTGWEGKHKWSQNQPVERRQRVLAALAAQPDADSQTAAAWMRQVLGNA